MDTHRFGLRANHNGANSHNNTVLLFFRTALACVLSDLFTKIYVLFVWITWMVCLVRLSHCYHSMDFFFHVVWLHVKFKFCNKWIIIVMDDCFVIILRIGEKFHDPAIESVIQCDSSHNCNALDFRIWNLWSRISTWFE